MAVDQAVYECGCAECLAGDHAERIDHRQLNLLLSRLDEQQRRWVASREAVRLGHGGFQRIAKITGLHPETIRRGRDELGEELRDRPTDHVCRTPVLQNAGCRTPVPSILRKKFAGFGETANAGAIHLAEEDCRFW